MTTYWSDQHEKYVLADIEGEATAYDQVTERIGSRNHLPAQL